MGALVLLPPLSKEEILLLDIERQQEDARHRQEVVRGQQCFEFLDVTIEVRMVVPRAKKFASKDRARGRYQYVIQKLAAPAVRDRRLDKTRVKKRERQQLEADVQELTAAGVYDRRPVRGNGVDGDCPTGPCPWMKCKFNLFITIRPSGSVKMNFPGKDIDEVGETCALRVAAVQAAKREPMPFEELGPQLGLTDSRAEQICAGAIKKLKAAGVHLKDDAEY